MVRYPPPVASDPTAKGDELGRTATAPVATSPAEPAGRIATIGASVGRYRLERELGEGGMGVVHAAFDPDLQRRVALKVLRIAAPSAEAKDRLLREARAMARLAHPNVVTVHEVGTASGRDYVAMELILGETLADWLRSDKRRAADIVAAFLAAGRGLAAAHAAGIVHRDFKPHNVLRSRHGRIVVTDFGLAREAQADLPAQLEATLPLSGRVVSFAASTPGSLSGITMTGSLLGTPAYMAPEQWEGGLVTPATDQFAYCVALWEALAGERPYRGPTLEELRAQAALGPRALDGSKIPRRLRAILRRGLDPDPAQRWPNMDALLARIVRAERRPGIAFAIAAGALVAASVLILAMRAGGELAARPRCEPPVLDPAQVWSSDTRASLGPQTAAARAIETELSGWRAARATACTAAPATRAPRLACLDGVLARIDAVARATRLSRDGSQVDAGALLIDPRVCELQRAPRLMTNTSPEFRDALATWLARSATPIPLRPETVAALVTRTAADPCASSLAHLLAANVQKNAADHSRHLDEAQQDAERCGDDRMLVETALASARYMLDNEWLSATVTTKLRLADAAVHRVEQRDLKAEIDLMRVEVAKRNERLDDAIKFGTEAMEGFAARGRRREQIRAGLLLLELRQTRATVEDLAAVPASLADWRARAVSELGAGDEVVRAIDSRTAEWAWARGEISHADAELDRVRRPLPNDRSKRVAGRVVDPRGKPVADATVTAAWSMSGDSLHAATAINSRDSMRATKTGPDGRFEIADAVEDAIVIAQLGDLRSVPTPGTGDVTLALAPTSRLEGHVELAGQAPTNVVIVVRDSSLAVPWRYGVMAPVAPDGSFAIDGIARHDVRMFAAIKGLSGQARGEASIKVRGPVVRGLSLSLARSTRVVHVLVRNTFNTKLANAQVVVLPGKVPSMSALAINQQFRGGSVRFARQLEGEHAPKEVVAAARPGDLFATVSDVPAGVASACALGLPELSDDEIGRKLMAHLDKIQVVCTPIPENTNVLTIEVPPFPRLD